MARFCTLASGSSGNAAYVGSGGSAVLVDLGISCKAAVTALKELNLEGSHLEGILITHEHIDHIRGLKVFLKSRRLPVYASGRGPGLSDVSRLLPGLTPLQWKSSRERPKSAACRWSALTPLTTVFTAWDIA